MITDTVSISEFLKAGRITMQADWHGCNPNMPDSANMDHGSVSSPSWSHDDESTSRKATATTEAPKAEDCLIVVASDAAGIDKARGFEDWCDELRVRHGQPQG